MTYIWEVSSHRHKVELVSGSAGLGFVFISSVREGNVPQQSIEDMFE